jgi:hypothetical protein
VTTRAFELRTYHCHPGKLAALHARFRNHSIRLLEKHGMKLLGFWTSADPAQAANRLIYLVAHQNREAAEASWRTFREDPEWKAAKADSEKEGPIVQRVESVFLNPTDYSALQ